MSSKSRDTVPLADRGAPILVSDDTCTASRKFTDIALALARQLGIQPTG
jgi:hypothetical protein